MAETKFKVALSKLSDYFKLERIFEPDEIDEMFDDAQRVARDENSELYYVPASMTYKEWEKTVVKII